MASMSRLVVVGAGLAGCEAAWQAASRGLDVRLYEMRPVRTSPAHATDDFAELVCSNSLRSDHFENAVGLLKEEMRRLGSLILRAADATRVPAGRALAVDRIEFSRYVTQAVESHPRIDVRRELVTRIPPDEVVIIATGPLTADELSQQLAALLGDASLYFYDAISPIIYADSIDYSVVFRASRYEEGEGDYLNAPLSRVEYERFIDLLSSGETVPLHSFEKALYFEGCLPIEEMARRGRDTLAFGPMKPVGILDPRTGKRPHAVLQLRQEDKRGILYNLVGFQTKLRIGEQKRILRTLPGLERAAFARYGSVHRNTYVNAPARLDAHLQVKRRPGLYLAGQMVGVEGYVESAALGFLAGVHAVYAARGREAPIPDPCTAHGALLRYLNGADPRNFQPMNVNYGLFPPIAEGDRRLPKRERHRRIAERGLGTLPSYADAIGAPVG
jgi:methylenetetrahydrofolate--tRNA-(uracil-5-)-methyltransferase